ncbi:rhomboid family intramembrane serine protease [Olleya sp. YSTF-M6]|uniref:Rhomboid family intramembrane serine protease n=1 Tax=Olleya sediminilitoris TaxID=2795739 RepID=A0ABS1WPC9_9FLAO|nr:rhomboid family intramembrane serine protease [Olleya sediminilitoris]MBL7560986.1 rhomboid family intramembrane serine protease [Olleya sediminilitoris]
MIKITDTVKHLIIINVLFWIATLVLVKNGIDLNAIFSMHFPLNNEFKIWQVITHMFMHASYVNFGNGPSIFFLHIFSNMLGLWMFGSAVEKNLGKTKFLFLYFSCGLGAMILPLIIDYVNFYSIISPLIENGLDTQMLTSIMNEGKYNPEWSNIVGEDNWLKVSRIFYQESLGASGCIMGLLVAFGMMYPNSELMLLFLPIPIKAKVFIPLLLAYEIYSGIAGGSSIFGFNVGHFAHIGGAIVGFIIIWYWRKTQFNKNRWDS